jgi:hypothetical protein
MWDWDFILIIDIRFQGSSATNNVHIVKQYFMEIAWILLKPHTTADSVSMRLKFYGSEN